MIDLLTTTFLQNPVFAGVAGGGILTAILYKLREIPALLAKRARALFTVEVEVENAFHMFDHLCVYLYRLTRDRNVRRLKLSQIYDEKLEKWTWTLGHGNGWHWFRDHGTFFFLSRSEEEEGKGFDLRKREKITLVILGRNPTPIVELLQRAECTESSENTVAIYTWRRGTYILSDQKQIRDLDTVFIPDQQKNAVCEDMRKFLESRERYRYLGIPYRRSYLFSGPPGTGKTSFIFALAGRFGKSVHSISLASLTDDDSLQEAFNSVRSSGFVVLEDVDTIQATHVRENQSRGKKEKGITLGGLLNAVDGLSSREGRIVLMTTNHPEKLDAALLRCGRVDRHEVIDLMEEPEARLMTAHFLGPETGVVFNEEILPMLPTSASSVQEKLLRLMEGNLAAIPTE